MTKIVINRCYGGFGLSDWAEAQLGDLPMMPGLVCHNWEDRRDHPALVALVEKDADKASGRYAALQIATIPDDVEWTIEEYDGIEWVAEKHRTWHGDREDPL